MKNNFPPVSRRNFFAAAAAATAAVIAAKNNSFAALATNAVAPENSSARKYPIGLEMYSVRTELARDLPNTLRQISKMGYTIAEFYAPYFDWTIPYAKEVRAMMDDLNLRCYSTHNHIESFTPGDSMNKAIELNQILGAKYLILATAPNGTNGVENWKKLCGQLSSATEQLKPHGLAPGFHNHQTEWSKLDGDQRVMDFLAANTPQEFVLQLDVGTCVEAGADPVAWINANPGRIKIAHLKDWAPGTRANEKSFRVLFGEGVSPWKEICAALESVGGVEFYLMEQEGSRFPEFETARRCLDAWKKFRANEA